MYRAALLAFLLSFAMTSLSAYIRLSDSNIGCDAWPTCFVSNIHVDDAPGITIAEDDTHVGLRAIHRFTASVFGLIALGLMMIAVWYRKSSGIGLTEPLLIFFLTMLLAIVGFYTPDLVKPVITLINLSGGMLLTALLWWWLRKLKNPSLSFLGSSPLLNFTTLLCFLAIVTGAWVSANYAAPACEFLMTCSDVTTGIWAEAFSPDRTLQLENGVLYFDGNESLIGLVHQGFAGALILLLTVLAVRRYQCAEYWQALLIPAILVGLLLIQGLYGVLSMTVANLHNLTAILLLLALLSLYKPNSVQTKP